MSARAMWKGIVTFGDIRVPVKLYSALEDRSVHFRLLHRSDQQPIRQALVNPETDEPVAYASTRRAFVADDGRRVMLDRDELDALEPRASRDITIEKFVPLAAIDHRWYDRPYYLGPDGDDDAYFALATALDGSDRQGLAHWVMRGKDYVGALRLHRGYPILVSLRHAEEVVPVESLQAPTGKPLDRRELSMARQLIGMLAAEFDPDEYHDEYRKRLLDMIEKKAHGIQPNVVPFRRREPPDDLSAVLAASLQQAKPAKGEPRRAKRG